MTFDFASDCRARPATPPPVVPPPGADLAQLVRDLFCEGALSYDQLWSLACLPDFMPLLAGLADAAPDRRRIQAAE